MTVGLSTGVLASNRKFTVTASGSTDGEGRIEGNAKTVPFGIYSFALASGPAGTQVQISEASLAYAGAVHFNGVPASNVTIHSNSSLTAMVPANETGKITVRVSGRTAASSSAFVVTN